MVRRSKDGEPVRHSVGPARRGHSALGRRHWLAWIGLAAWLAGCTMPKPAPDNHVSAAVRMPVSGSLVLLLHLPSHDRQFAKGDPLVARLVSARLQAAGYRVGRVDWEDYRLLLVHELRGLPTQAVKRDHIEAEGRALARLARIGGEAEGSALLVRTRLLLREAEIDMSHAIWDGQRRPILKDHPARVSPHFVGSGPALSVELLVYDPTGRLVAKTYGGVAVPFHDIGGGRVADRTDLFDTDREAAEGVDLAMTAWLKPPPAGR